MADVIDWQSIESYSEVASASAGCHDFSHDDFLIGPIGRMIEIANNTDYSNRARARVMEYARVIWVRFVKERGCSEQQAENARGYVADAVTGTENDQAYMLEVWDGTSTHNYRRQIAAGR